MISVPVPVPIPAREQERLAALQHYRLEITGQEPEFDRIAHQAADLFDAPIALVTLVLEDEQRFMGICGLTSPGAPRDIAFCAHVLSGEEVFVIPDARLDPRFACNPLVTGPPHIRFYAGAPLMLAPGLVAGSLCVIGPEPREFGPVERRRLAALAETVVDMISNRLGRLMARNAEERAESITRQRDEILDAMPASLAVYDSEGLLLRTNRLFRATFHPDQPELIRRGMSPAEVWQALETQGHHPLRNTSEMAWLEVGSSERRPARRAPFEIRLADGRTLRGSETATGSGQVISVKMDISDIKAGEATIKAQEALLRTTLETIEHGVVVVDSDLKVALFNERYFAITRCPSALKQIGIPIEALLRAWVQDQELTEAEPDELVRIRLASLYRKESQSAELRTRDGRHVLFTRIAMPDGRFLVTVRDVTARREADRMKDEFVATVSHELRTPLTSIGGSLGLLAAGVGGTLNDQGRRLLDIAQKNSGRLVRLINDLLDIGKMEAGKLDFAFRPLPLVAALRQAMEENRPYAERLGVTLDLILPQENGDAEGLIVSADADRLQQVMTNLISNAAKFSTRGDRVTLALERRRGDMARITVTDQGPGIPEEFRCRIFQKFAQADATSGRMQEGTGLGLAIAQALVERHGGRIGFAPGPGGHGTRFHVDLPLSRPIASPSAEVLVCVDKDAGAAAGYMEAVLRRAGLEAARVSTVADALNRLAAPPAPHAVMLEAGMLNQGGITLVEAMREREALRGVRLLVLAVSDSDAAMASGVVKGGALDLADWITGPEAIERMPRALRATLAASQSDAPDRTRPRILHVEDDPDLRHLAALSLGDAAEVVAAPDLATALKALAADGDAFDLVILDIDLPDGSGLDLLPLLRLPGGISAKVVIYSAYEPDAEAARGVAAVLAKSRVSVADLASTVRQLVYGDNAEAKP